MMHFLQISARTFGVKSFSFSFLVIVMFVPLREDGIYVSGQLSSGIKENACGPWNVDELKTLFQMGSWYDSSIMFSSLPPHSQASSRRRRQLQQQKLPFECGFSANYTLLAPDAFVRYLKNGTCTEKTLVD
jgi:hypothetical protein